MPLAQPCQGFQRAAALVVGKGNVCQRLAVKRAILVKHLVAKFGADRRKRLAVRRGQRMGNRVRVQVYGAQRGQKFCRLAFPVPMPPVKPIM